MIMPAKNLLFLLAQCIFEFNTFLVLLQSSSHLETPQYEPPFPHIMSQHTAEIEVESWIDIVRQKVSALRFGSVQIIVHEGRVTQVESTEKTRLPSEPLAAPARK